MTVPHPASNTQPVLIEKFGAGFFQHKVADGIPAFILEFGIPGVGIDHGAHFDAHGCFKSFSIQRVG
jgi:hypothetical protein